MSTSTGHDSSDRPRRRSLLDLLDDLIPASRYERKPRPAREIDLDVRRRSRTHR